MDKGPPLQDGDIRIVSGTVRDAPWLAQVFKDASHGLAQYFWSKNVEPGSDPEQVILKRMETRISDPEGRFRLAKLRGATAGGMFSRNIGPEPESTEGMNAVVRALQNGENDLLNTHYINAVAVFPEFRRLGLARALLSDAAKASDRPLSLIVADANHDAIRLYESFGFHEVSRHVMEKDDWDGEGDWWIAMRRDV